MTPTPDPLREPGLLTRNHARATAPEDASGGYFEIAGCKCESCAALAALDAPARTPTPAPLRANRPGHYAIGLRDGGSSWHIGTTYRSECRTCLDDGWVYRTAQPAPALDVERLREALKVCIQALDSIGEMSDATEQSSFREEAWAALEHVDDALRAALEGDLA